MGKNIGKTSTKNEIPEAYNQLLEQIEQKDSQLPEKPQAAKIEKGNTGT